jgi:hypothetical protein
VTCPARIATTTDSKSPIMRLNPPSIPVFLIALVLATLAMLMKTGFVAIPRYLPHQEYRLAISAYFVLLIGNIAKGL